VLFLGLGLVFLCCLGFSVLRFYVSA